MQSGDGNNIKGWVLYDGTCGFCSRWVPYWANTLAQRGFRIAPLQTPWVADRLKLTPEEISADFRLLLTNGEQRAGADVYRYLMRRIWWAWPLYLFSILPGFRTLFDKGYRAFADNRHRFSKACGLPPADLSKNLRDRT